MKKILCWVLCAAMCICAWIALAQHAAAVSVTFDEMVNASASIIRDNEGWYNSVNRDDNGALSVGWLQWHANRALNLLKSIAAADTSSAKTLLGDALYKEITTSTDWSTRTVTADEASKLSALLDSSAGHTEQDKLAKNDISVYINHGMTLGINDPSALVFFADVENQCGGGGAGKVAAAASATAGSYEKITLEILYKAALNDSAAGKYSARRDKTYSYCLLLGWDSIAGDYEVWTALSGVNVRKGPDTKYELVATLYTSNSTVIIEKRLVDGYLWGKSHIGWLCLDYCEYRIGTLASPVGFDTCGGVVNEAACTFAVDAVNTVRASGQIIVYTNECTTENTPTNQYGAEIVVDKYGVVTEDPVFGSCKSLIPEGGFVISGHYSKGYALCAAVSKGDMIIFDSVEMTLYIYKNENDYLIASKTVTADKKIGALPYAVREGKIFDGWYSAESGGDPIRETDICQTHGALKLFAHWRNAASATVVFDAAGGSIDNTAQTALTAINTTRAYDALVVYNNDLGAANTPTNEWGAEAAVDADGRVTVLPVNGSCKTPIPEGGFVLSGHNVMAFWLVYNIKEGSYASYDEVAMTVTVYKDKQTYEALNKNISEGSQVGALPTVTRQYFEFLGWYTQSGALASEKTTVPAGGLVLTAKWEPLPGKILYNTDGGALKTSCAVASLAGVDIARTANTLVLYKTKAATGTNPYGSEAIISNDGTVIAVLGYGAGNSTVPDGCSVLSGHGTMSTWINKNLHAGGYVVISGNNISAYDSYGAYLNKYSPTVKYGSSWCELPCAEKEGYEFDGWTDKNGNEIKAGDEVTLLGDITLTAKWKGGCTVTFDAVGGKMSASCLSVAYTSVNTQRVADSLILYVAKQTTGTNAYGAEVLVDADGTVTAVCGYGEGNNPVPYCGFVLSGHGSMATWLKNNVKVGNYAVISGKSIKIYNSKKDYDAANGKVILSSGDTLVTLPSATKADAVFAGWFDSDKNEVSGNMTVTKSMSVKAKWLCSKADAVFELDGGAFKSLASATLTGTNIGRTANTLVLYKDKATTGTNPYGTEVLISSDGTVLAILFGGNNTIPAGCSVLSGHGTMASWINANLKAGNYINIVSGKVTVWKSRTEYTAQSSPVVLEVGKKYGTLPTPSKSGYTFGGWIDSEGKLIDENTVVTSCEDPTLKATWTKEVTVTFSAEGGKLGCIAQATIDGYNTGRLANQLICYAGKSSTGTNIYGTEAVIGADGIVTAVYTSGKDHSVPKNGTVLSGNGTASTWIRNNVKVGNYVVISASKVKVYASAADFEAESGKINVPRGVLSALPTPTKSNCTFIGWFDESGTLISANSTVSNDIQLKAKWVTTSAKVVYDLSGGAVCKASATLTGTNIGRTANTLVLYKDKATTGTNPYGTEVLISSDGTVLAILFGGNNTIPAGCSILSGHGTMASWINANLKAGNYINIDSGKVTVWNDSADHGAMEKTIRLNYRYGTLPTPSKSGYAFGGWIDSEGKLINENTVVTSCEDPTLKAIWTEKVTVTFSAEGGKLGCLAQATLDGYNTGRLANQLICYAGKSSTGTNIYGTEAVIEADGIVTAVYTSGKDHSVPKNGTVLSGNGTASTWIKNNVKVGNYVVISASKVKVYASAADFEAESGKITVPCGVLSALPTPTKSNCTFIGWFDESGKSYSAGCTVNDDIKLFAKWN